MAAPRVSRATFNEDLVRRLRFEREARQHGLAFRARYLGSPRRLTYDVKIDVPVYDEQRNLRITLKPSVLARPIVTIDGPICLRHRFAEHSLCMWWAEDPEENRWTTDDGLLALVGHATDHAYCEAT